MKRSFRMVAVCLLLSLIAPAAAQEATPEASTSILADLGYPELRITAGNDGVDMPTQVKAGRTLIVYENISQESTHPFMLRLPGNVNADQALADLGPEALEPPEWFLDAHFPGFVGETLPGQTSHAVVDLAAGSHLVLHDAPALLEVVSADGTPVPDQTPPANGTASLFEMGFELPNPVAPGRQVWEVTNIGTLPHEVLLVRSSAPVTASEIIELFSSENENATPVGGGPSLAEIEPVGGLGWLSPGSTAWTELDLQPGHYAAVCFVFDPETGMPHLMLGMVDDFTVGDDGTPTAATPVG